ncbi:hypothetical protein [Streptomyces sp. NPDC059466]|uniref:hypothetical protein n=1 Tax=unclassified Streptomyces TaxID=2593676 RepID=UPI0036C70103
MRHSPGPLPRRATVDRFAPRALRTAGGPAKADGDHGGHGGTEVPPSLSVRDGGPTARGDAGGPLDDVLGLYAAAPDGPLDDVLGPSTASPRNAPAERVPTYSNTPGYDVGVRGPDTEFRLGGDQLAVRLVSQRDAAWVGALFAAVDAQR